jgi:hypothetical protein
MGRLQCHVRRWLCITNYPSATPGRQLCHRHTIFLPPRLASTRTLSPAPPPAAGEADLRQYLDKWDRKYWATYKVLDILQKVFYRSNPAREAFVEMCESTYVQKMTFDSYLYKTGERGELDISWG